MSKGGDYPIPFSKKSGDQLHYADGFVDRYQGGIDWRENTPFEATVEYTGFSRGRSSAVLTFKNVDTGVNYTMFLKEFDGCAKHLLHGRLTGPFRFIKRGTNYGLWPQ